MCVFESCLILCRCGTVAILIHYKASWHVMWRTSDEVNYSCNENRLLCSSWCSFVWWNNGCPGLWNDVMLRSRSWKSIISPKAWCEFSTLKWLNSSMKMTVLWYFLQKYQLLACILVLANIGHLYFTSVKMESCRSM